jgi:hypothetical protein
MTKAGRILAKQIESDINSSVVDEKISNDKIMDSYKKGIIQDYKKILEDKYYIDFDVSKDEIDINFIWSFFDVIPYTQLSMIKSYLSEVKNYSIFIKDEKCKIFCDMMLSKL